MPKDDVQRETVLGRCEIVTEVVLPPPVPGLRSSYRKVRPRRSWDFPLVGLALALNFSGKLVSRAAVAFSGIAPIPWRSRPAEEAITGTALDSATIAKAVSVAVKGAEPPAHNGYKILLCRAVLEEGLAALPVRLA